MLENLKPEKVFRYFEEISAIPRGSGNVTEIADYCMRFAASKGLKAVKEDCGNVIIYAEGTKGYESSPAVILQGHLDMVCEKASGCKKDMEKEGLDLRTDGENVWAEGTTLGGDDGIAIAYMLALLDSDDIPHPPIEALLTVDEETGMTGAELLDGSLLKGKRLINIDSEEEGFITVSCAGGVRAGCKIPAEFIKTGENMLAFVASIDGFTGGHSGVDIDKNRLSAHKIMGSLLSFIGSRIEIFAADLHGGTKTNVIPKSAAAVLVTGAENRQALIVAFNEYADLFRGEFSSHEPNARFEIKEATVPEKHADRASTDKIIFALENAPDGICAVMKNAPQTVKTSLNMGEMSFADSLKLGFLIRSNSLAGKKLIMEKLSSFIRHLSGEIEFDSDYPSWEYRENSPLRDTATEVYSRMYGKNPIITSIHAGLECGLLSKKIQGADMVSIGPDLENVHTPDEKMNVASVKRTWEYLLEILKTLR